MERPRLVIQETEVIDDTDDFQKASAAEIDNRIQQLMQEIEDDGAPSDYSEEEDDSSELDEESEAKMGQALMEPIEGIDIQQLQRNNLLAHDKIRSSDPKVLFRQSKISKSKQKPLTFQFKRDKNNSTSSLYIKDTIENPNIDEVIRCMSVAVLYHVKNVTEPELSPLFVLFDETLNPLTKVMPDFTKLPDVVTVYRFISTIFRVQALPAEVAILALNYTERLIAKSGVSLHQKNWRRVLLGAIVVASKVWEEDAVWNADFIDMFPLLDINNLNALERQFLELLQYNVAVSASQYAKYYFELRALSSLDAEHFPLEPMNKDAAAKLEERSKAKEVNEKRKVLRSRSVDTMTQRPIRTFAVLQ